MKDILTFDASTARRIDENGYLHVSGNRITKAVVNPYYGHEIPGWEEAGLDPEKVDYGFRAPEELKKAVGTFSGVPMPLGWTRMSWPLCACGMPMPLTPSNPGE